MLQRIIAVFLSIAVLAFCSMASFAADESADRKSTPIADQGAELFGLTINDLSKENFEKRLSAMGLQPYPSYKKGVATYSLGQEGILGIRELAIQFNDYDYLIKATMSGVVESNKKRQALGSLLVKKYGMPNIGYVRDGYGRAKWVFQDGTYIELHNTTFNVLVIYVDQQPKTVSESGQIDVEALYKKSQKSAS
ncbi:uridine kinase [Marinomonas pollencensis]|uniref:SUKH-3 immunity protein of toxin-antitoxin system n=1 Tax=Marinomonas pollencensis TaxID=491954 RepID=A0A3E0DQE3_9GAMM|nr:uridine kinase [Marinomonas pollencensis]REG85099.1 hypothetical protein DFP81_103298 [Marinomonas pollencensis]